ncbi:hypothetical protein AALO_G00307920, partial [Alosa alosa]
MAERMNASGSEEEALTIDMDAVAGPSSGPVTPKNRISKPDQDLANAPARKKPKPIFTSRYQDPPPNELGGKERWCNIILGYDFNFQLGQLSLYTRSELIGASPPKDPIILRSYDFKTCQGIIGNCLKGKTEGEESISAVWCSVPTNDENVYIRCFCCLKNEAPPSFFTLSRQVGDDEEKA